MIDGTCKTCQQLYTNCSICNKNGTEVKCQQCQQRYVLNSEGVCQSCEGCGNKGGGHGGSGIVIIRI